MTTIIVIDNKKSNFQCTVCNANFSTIHTCKDKLKEMTKFVLDLDGSVVVCGEKLQEKICHLGFHIAVEDNFNTPVFPVCLKYSELDKSGKIILMLPDIDLELFLAKPYPMLMLANFILAETKKAVMLLEAEYLTGEQ